MSRLSLLAAAVLSVAAASAQAVIVYEPLPVPGACSTTLPPYYQRQLYVLNHPYGGYGSIDLSYENPCDRPTVNLNPQPCQYQPQPDPCYYRKSDFLPHADPAYSRTPGPTSKGVILIIPKSLLNRPLNSFSTHPEPLALRD